MKTVTVTVKQYPYVCVSADGKHTSSGLNSWNTWEEGHIADSGNIFFELPAIDVSFEVPDDHRQQTLEVLRKHRAKLQGEHQAMLTKLQFLENSLLGLAAPEVLDAAPGYREVRELSPDPDGDIPF